METPNCLPFFEISQSDAAIVKKRQETAGADPQVFKDMENAVRELCTNVDNKTTDAFYDSERWAAWAAHYGYVTTLHLDREDLQSVTVARWEDGFLYRMRVPVRVHKGS